MRLKGKHALITGAAGGIGLATACSYLREGAHCSLFDRSTSLAVQAVEQLNTAANVSQCKWHYQAGDITASSEVQAWINAAEQRLGAVSILFNNAAIFDMAPLLASDEALYKRIFDVNVKGMFFTMQTALQHMVNAKTRGAVINMASQAGRRGEALVSHYCASKAAVISYTQSAALAMAPHRIRVNAIAPGVIDTPMWETVDSLFAKFESRPLGEKKRLVGQAVPLGYMGQAQDICGAAVFLASDESAYITAQTLNVDGGSVMS